MNKRFIIRILTISLVSFSINYGYSQQNHEKEFNHKTHVHKHNNEICTAVGIVVIPEENETALGFHLHYIKGVGQKNRLGIGIGLGTILEEHKHYTISLATHYRIYKGFIIGYAPGLLILKHDSNKDFNFAQHIEFNYEFELGNIHLGPTVEMDLANSIMHYMAGIHLGLDF